MLLPTPCPSKRMLLQTDGWQPPPAKSHFFKAGGFFIRIHVKAAGWLAVMLLCFFALFKISRFFLDSWISFVEKLNSKMDFGFVRAQVHFGI